jgi:hypothetical protein
LDYLVDLEAQLSSPSQALKRLVRSWRALPPHDAPPSRRPPPRIPQRAEDRLGADGVAQLCADYQAGQSSKKLQRMYGLSQGAVLRLLEVNGVSRRQRGLTDLQVRQAVELYLRGWALTRIGDHFGKDHTVVRNALLRGGVTLRADRRRAAAELDGQASPASRWTRYT